MGGLSVVLAVLAAAISPREDAAPLPLPLLNAVQTSARLCEDYRDAVCEAWQRHPNRAGHARAGMITTLQLDGVTRASFSDQQLAAFKRSVARVLQWPVDRIVDVAVSDNHNCDRVVLSATVTNGQDGSVEQLDDPRLGDYVRVSSVSARPVFRQPQKNGWFLYFGATSGGSDDGRRPTGDEHVHRTTKHWWVAGPSLGSHRAGLVAPQDVELPDQATKWYAFDTAAGGGGHWARAPTLRAVCVSKRRTNVRFHAASSTCDGAEAARIEHLPMLLKRGLAQVRHDLLFAGIGQGQLRNVLARQMHVIDCNPKIMLELGAAQGQHVTRERDGAECVRRMSHEVMRHWGCETRSDLPGDAVLRGMGAASHSTHTPAPRITEHTDPHTGRRYKYNWHTGISTWSDVTSTPTTTSTTAAPHSHVIGAPQELDWQGSLNWQGAETGAQQAHAQDTHDASTASISAALALASSSSADDVQAHAQQLAAAAAAGSASALLGGQPALDHRLTAALAATSHSIAGGPAGAALAGLSDVNDPIARRVANHVKLVRLSHLIGSVDPNLDASVGGSTHLAAATEPAATTLEALAPAPSASVDDMLAAFAAASGSGGGGDDSHGGAGGSGVGTSGGGGVGGTRSGTGDAGATSIAAALALASSSSAGDVQAHAEQLAAAASASVGG